VALFRRITNSKSPEVRWLASTQVRQRPRRRWRGLVAALVLDEIGFVAIVFLTQRWGADPPRDKSVIANEASQTKTVEHGSSTAPPQPLGGTETPSEPAPRVEPSAAEAPADADPETHADDVQSPDAPTPASTITGAFPTPSSDAADPAASNFAVYLNEFAPDQSGALALAIGAQRRFGAVLGGARFSYKRVRAAGNEVWRLRVAGFSRERAAQICQAVSEMGGACEVGPK
jgi:hypothetical protein